MGEVGVAADPERRGDALDLVGRLRDAGLWSEMDLGDRSLKAQFKVEVHGLGYSLVRVSLPRFDAEINLLVLSSPVDEENIILRTAAAVKNWGPSAWTHFVREAASIGLNREVGQDAPVWETKRYVEKPILAEGDGPIAEYRRYCKQFYPEQQAEGASKATKLPVVAA